MTDVRPLQTVAELLARARSQIGLPITYRMGGGVIRSHYGGCADKYSTCDCSSFVCWSLLLDKYGDYPWLLDDEYKHDHDLTPSSKTWYGTANIYRDAHALEDGLFDEIAKPEPGCLILFPEYKREGKRIPGHVGIVTVTIDDTRPLWGLPAVIHCSSGNQREAGHAVDETGSAIFNKRPNLIYAWCRLVAWPT